MGKAPRRQVDKRISVQRNNVQREELQRLIRLMRSQIEGFAASMRELLRQLNELFSAGLFILIGKFKHTLFFRPHRWPTNLIVIFLRQRR